MIIIIMLIDVGDWVVVYCCGPMMHKIGASHALNEICIIIYKAAAESAINKRRRRRRSTLICCSLPQEWPPLFALRSLHQPTSNFSCGNFCSSAPKKRMWHMHKVEQSIALKNVQATRTRLRPRKWVLILILILILVFVVAVAAGRQMARPLIEWISDIWLN